MTYPPPDHGLIKFLRYVLMIFLFGCCCAALFIHFLI